MRYSGRMRPSDSPLIAVLGGSFNPPHVGHLRMALEVKEALGPQKVLFIPAAVPPHKPAGGLLPFALREEMLEKALAGLPGLEVCPMENERPGPSYTVDTLSALSAAYPEARLGFILGGEDLALLHTWSRWERLPELADLIILPRGDGTEQDFFHTVRHLWPEAAPLNPLPSGASAAFHLPRGGRILYLSQPRLEISSSLVRSRWRQGKSLDFLVPRAVIEVLEAHRTAVAALWGQELPEQAAAKHPHACRGGHAKAHTL